MPGGRAAAALAAALLLLLGGAARAEGQAASTCVDVRIGDDRYYDCLNRLLKESVPPQGGRPPGAELPSLSATSPPNQVGTVTQGATRQMLGTSYGTSLVPQRIAPDIPSGGPPLARGGGR